MKPGEREELHADNRCTPAEPRMPERQETRQTEANLIVGLSQLKLSSITTTFMHNPVEQPGVVPQGVLPKRVERAFEPIGVHQTAQQNQPTD